MDFPIPGFGVDDPIGSVAHVIQVALTPVFMLSGIGTLLNVFNTRLSRLSDHTDHLFEVLSQAGQADDEGERRRLSSHLRRMRSRRMMLDASIIFGAIGGASTCGAAFVLFLGSLRENAIAVWLFVLFGVALGCTICALVAFLVDSVLAWHGLHRDGPLPRLKA